MNALRYAQSFTNEAGHPVGLYRQEYTAPDRWHFVFDSTLIPE